MRLLLDSEGERALTSRYACHGAEGDAGSVIASVFEGEVNEGPSC